MMVAGELTGQQGSREAELSAFCRLVGSGQGLAPCFSKQEVPVAPAIAGDADKARKGLPNADDAAPPIPVRSMLRQCANPQCSKPFLRLREGKLFLVETRSLARARDMAVPTSRARYSPPQVERYWLCDECSVVWTLVDDAACGITLIPLRRPVSCVPAAAVSRGQSA
jgi:hypothetical protein